MLAEFLPVDAERFEDLAVDLGDLDPDVDLVGRRDRQAVDHVALGFAGDRGGERAQAFGQREIGRLDRSGVDRGRPAPAQEADQAGDPKAAEGDEGGAITTESRQGSGKFRQGAGWTGRQNGHGLNWDRRKFTRRAAVESLEIVGEIVRPRFVGHPGDVVGAPIGRIAGAVPLNQEAKRRRHAVRCVRNRGFQVSDAVRDRILSCTDPDQLHTWLRRVATATSAEEAIGG